ncbi:hypothetical protein [Micromonospora sp. NPDC049171]|uniref:hypothetical protein n=1 Tax=Micromonospora sp. NPDC049171 TaxID=3155770 RepID=UPI0033FEBE18
MLALDPALAHCAGWVASKLVARGNYQVSASGGAGFGTPLSVSMGTSCSDSFYIPFLKFR